MAAVVVSPADFKDKFPEFAVVADAAVQSAMTMATMYISQVSGGRLNDEQRIMAIYLLTAVILLGNAKTASGKFDATLVGSATIDKVSITAIPPIASTTFAQWLSGSIYGKMLLALLDLKASAPMYMGGSRTRVL